MHSNEEINAWEREAYQKLSKDQLLGVEKYFHSIGYYNIPFIRFLDGIFKLRDRRILDYGCGTGMFCELFREISKSVAGCDYSPDQLSSARRWAQPGIHFFEDDYFKSSLIEKSFDFIFCRDLGPLQKIAYVKDNIACLNSLTSALSEHGAAYFILMGNLSGKAGDSLADFPNPTLKSIHEFFSAAGAVAMINAYCYQSVTVARSREIARAINERMLQAVMRRLYNLREYDEVGYLKCRAWLYVNSGIDASGIRTDFETAENYFAECMRGLLCRGLVDFGISANQVSTNTAEPLTCPPKFEPV